MNLCCSWTCLHCAAPGRIYITENWAAPVLVYTTEYRGMCCTSIWIPSQKKVRYLHLDPFAKKRTEPASESLRQKNVPYLLLIPSQKNVVPRTCIWIFSGKKCYCFVSESVFRLWIRIHMFFGLQDPDPFLVRGMDPDSAPYPDPSIIKQKY